MVDNNCPVNEVENVSQYNIEKYKKQTNGGPLISFRQTDSRSTAMFDHNKSNHDSSIYRKKNTTRH